MDATLYNYSSRLKLKRSIDMSLEELPTAANDAEDDKKSTEGSQVPPIETNASTPSSSSSLLPNVYNLNINNKILKVFKKMYDELNKHSQPNQVYYTYYSNLSIKKILSGCKCEIIFVNDKFLGDK